ncbi:hypothetical protein KUTeg_023758 [Tegillarca granosa]|uniref:Biotin-protein ligase N-terminal domain-containing protein n=1 Tax=Tegillarca granosa TaxID=220873 RepID=A0ABQ9E8Q5_TEGGR|nr:hypothetical protein KUTeg_023758 [Tegillarca granosa]
MGPAGTKQIHDYVIEGGSYLGLCAGAYFASDYIEFDKNGPLEVCGERYLKFYPGLCVGPVYGPFNYITEMGARPAKFTFDDQDHSNMNESEIEGTSIQKCSEFKCYFNGGGLFLPYNKGKPVVEKVYEERNMETKINIENKMKANLKLEENIVIDRKEDEVSLKEKENIENPYVLTLTYQEDAEWCKKGDNSIAVQVLARYQGITGNPACIVKIEVGKGTAVLSGPHIEYDSCSLDDDNVYLKFVKDEICSYDHDQNLWFSQLLKHVGLL